jgi:hypothetical protein
VGFLDDLKRQADALKTQQQIDVAALDRNTQLADIACKTAFSYFSTLASQLNVLQPTSRYRFALDRQHAFDALQLTAFRTDARRKTTLRGAEVYDHVVLHWELKSGRRLDLVKNFPPDIERLESRLRQGGAQVDTEIVRQPDGGKLQEMRYGFTADFFGSVKLHPLHDEGSVRFTLSNLDGFENVSVEFAAFEIGNPKLDELARWLLGERHAFLDGGRHLRRVEA